MTVALRQRPLARVVMGIVKSANGAMLDPSDMTTLYQDAAGTIPVTAVEQPVGLILDKSQGLVLGPELVTNGTFDSDGSGWSQVSWSPILTDTAIASVAGEGYLVSTVGFARNYQQITTVVGKWYSITADARVGTSSGIYIYAGTVLNGNQYGEVTVTSTTNKKLRLIFLATTTTTYITTRLNPSGGSLTGFIDNISVRELYGNHATQSVTASRPTLSARYNLLTKTEDFSDAVWTKVGITLSQALGPNGVTGAYKITEDLTTGVHRLSQAVSSSASSYIVYIKNDGANYCVVGWRSNSDIRYDAVRYNLLTKSKIVVQNSTGLSVSDSIVDIGDGWLKITITLTSAAQFNVGCANPTKDPSYLVTYTGDGVSGLIVYHPQVSPSVITPYQRVNTAADYDTDERYFPKYLRFDGVDDYLNLPYMGLYAGGSASLVAAVLMSNRNPQRLVHEANTANSLPWYGLFRNAGGVCGAGTLDDTGAAILSNTATYGDVSKIKIVAEVDSGTTASTYINSLVGDSDAYSRTGKTVSLNTTSIGASVSTTTSGFMDGKLYGLLIAKSALSDAQRIQCERFLAKKTGVML